MLRQHVISISNIVGLLVITSAEEGGYVFGSVCLSVFCLFSVCLSVCAKLAYVRFHFSSANIKMECKSNQTIK